MKSVRRRWMRAAVLVVCTLPLLATGPCLTITTESIMGGAFDGLTVTAVARLRDQLGVSTAGNSSGSQTSAVVSHE